MNDHLAEHIIADGSDGAFTRRRLASIPDFSTYMIDPQSCQKNERTPNMTEPDSEILRAAIFEIIENQIREDTPPETKKTFDRLMADGHSHEDTMKMIGCVVSSEIFDVLKHNQPYNEERYVSALQALPELPWEHDDWAWP